MGTILDRLTWQIFRPFPIFSDKRNIGILKISSRESPLELCSEGAFPTGDPYIPTHSYLMRSKLKSSTYTWYYLGQNPHSPALKLLIRRSMNFPSIFTGKLVSSTLCTIPGLYWFGTCRSVICVYGGNRHLSILVHLSLKGHLCPKQHFYPSASCCRCKKLRNVQIMHIEGNSEACVRAQLWGPATVY